MKSRRNHIFRIRPMAVLFIILSIGVIWPGAGFGLTPAGYVIKNQASAIFQWGGQYHIVNSNQVSTVVDPIYRFEISPDGTVAQPGLTARPGACAPVIFSYVLINTGNETDSYALSLPLLDEFSDFEPHLRSFHLDVNENGMLDPGETEPITSISRVRPGDFVHFLVSFDVPCTAGNGDELFLDVQGISAGDPSITDVDNVNKTLVSDGPFLSSAKTASLVNVGPGGVVTYIIDVRNVGGTHARGTETIIDGVKRAGVLISDTIPEHETGGTRYVAGSLDGAPVGQRRIFSTDGAVTWKDAAGGEPPPDAVTHLGYFIEQRIDPGQSARMRFSVRISDRHEEALIRNTADIRYADVDPTPIDDRTPPHLIRVMHPPENCDVYIGPQDAPLALGTADLTGDGVVDADDDATLDDGIPAEDPNPQGIQVAGNVITFYNTVRNHANTPDTINLIVDSLPDVPPDWPENAAWFVQIFQQDGMSPLPDTDGDGNPDTARLEPGEEMTVAVKVMIPVDALDSDNEGKGFRTTIRAQSGKNPNIYNLTHDIVPAVIALGKFWDPFRKEVETPPVVVPNIGLTYVNTFGNTGPGKVHNVYIRDKLDDRLINPRNMTEGVIHDMTGADLSITASASYDPVTRTITWYIPEIPNQFIGQVRFMADVAPGVENQMEIPNVFTINCDEVQTAQTSNEVNVIVGGHFLLKVDKKANLEKAAIGDPVLYEVTVENASDILFKDVVLRDLLPRGFRLLPDSAERNGASFVPDISDDGEVLTWRIGDLQPQTTMTFLYAAILTPEAIKGDGKNTATVSGETEKGSQLGPFDSAFQIEVQEGIFHNESIIIGRVFIDQNDNRIQEEAEPGVEGVRLYLEDGTFVLTDREGKYHFEGVKPGMHVIRLDETTLPEDMRLGVIDSQNAHNPASRFVDLRYGTLHKANFRVTGCPEWADGGKPEDDVALRRPWLARNDRLTRVNLYYDAPTTPTLSMDSEGVVRVLLPNVTHTEFEGELAVDDPRISSIRAFTDRCERITELHIRTVKDKDCFPNIFATTFENGLEMDVGAMMEDGPPLKPIPGLENPLDPAPLEPLEMKDGELKPIRVERLDGVSQVVLEYTQPSRETFFRDAASGIIHITLPGVVKSEQIPIRKLDDSNVSAIRAWVIKDKDMTKVQIRLKKRTSGYPEHRVAITKQGMIVEVGRPKNPDNDPETPAKPEPGPETEDPETAFRILSPSNGESFIARSQITVNVEAHLAAQFELFVNDQPVSKQLIGKKAMNVKKRRAAYEYVSVPIEKGRNVLRFEVINPGPKREPENAEIIVYRSADPKSVRVTAIPENLMADARTEPVVHISLLDENNVPTANGAVITVSVDKGDILSPDLRKGEPGHQAHIRDGKAIVRLSAASEAETRTLQILAGEMEKTAIIRFSPHLRDWIVNGVVSGELSHTENKAPKTGEKDKETDISERIAVFVKGKLPKDVSLTASYDSTKDEDDRKIFQENDPMKYYPVYGDDSEQDYEAESRDKLYVKMEKDKSYLMYGDVETELDQNKLSAFKRNFTGAKLNVETPWVDARGFFSRNDQAQATVELRGEGTSGYYHLPDTDLIVNSEEITIETRDRHHPDQVLESETKSRFTDYDIDYDLGRILFKAPVFSQDEDHNPVFIVARYEVDGRKNKDYNTFGGRASVHDPDRNVEVGATYIEDQAEPSDYRLQGVDATVKLPKDVTVRAEYAQSDSFEEETDDAYLIEAEYEGERGTMTAYHRETGKDFDNPNMSGNAAGRRSTGLEGEIDVTENLSIEDEIYTEKDEVSQKRRHVGIHDFIYQTDRYELRIGGGYVEEKDLAPEDGEDDKLSSPFLRAGGSVDLTRRLSLELLHQQALSSDVTERSTYTELDLAYRFSDYTKYLVGAERRKVEDGGYDYNLVAGVESQLTESLNGFNRYTLEDAADGRRVRSGTGLELKHQATPEWLIGATGEIGHTLDGDGDGNNDDFWAATTSFEYHPEKKDYTTIGRFEVRDEDVKTSYLTELGGTLKVNLNHTLFGRNIFNYIENKDDGDQSGWSVDVLTGWAYRPVNYDAFNLLGDVEWKYDENLGDVNDASRLNRILLSVETNYNPAHWLVLEGKYAFKYTMASYAENTFTDLKAAKARLDLTDWLFTFAGARVLSQYDTSTHTVGYGAGVGVNVAPDIRFQVGYNFEGFRDDDFSRSENWEKGLVFGLHWKFDESLLGILNRLEGKKDEPKKKSDTE